MFTLVGGGQMVLSGIRSQVDTTAPHRYPLPRNGDPAAGYSFQGAYWVAKGWLPLLVGGGDFGVRDCGTSVANSYHSFTKNGRRKIIHCARYPTSSCSPIWAAIPRKATAGSLSRRWKTSSPSSKAARRISRRTKTSSGNGVGRPRTSPKVEPTRLLHMPENFEKPSMSRLCIALITEEQQMVPGAFPFFLTI